MHVSTTKYFGLAQKNDDDGGPNPAHQYRKQKNADNGGANQFWGIPLSNQGDEEGD